MRIDYELNKQDYIDFNIYHFKHSEILKKSMFYQRFIIPIIFLIAPFIFARVSDIPFLIWFITFLITTFIWIAFYPKYFMSVTIKRISKMVDEGKNNDLLGSHSLIADEKELIEKSKNGETHLNWDGVEKIVSAENHLFIYVSSISANVIPKRAFENQNTMDEFYRYVNEKIGEKQS